MRARTTGVLLALGMLLGACGGGDGGDGDSAGTTQVTQNLAADRALAEQAVLRISDFPPGWEAKPHEEAPDDPTITRQMSECLKVDLALLERDNPASADSPDFKSPEQAEVDNSVGIAPSNGKAQELFTIFERPDTPGCLTKAVAEVIQQALKRPKAGEELPQGVTVGQVTINRASFPTMGERTVAFRATVPVRFGGLDLNLYADFVLALKGRAAALLFFSDVGSPFPTEQALRLTKIVVDRLPA